jgi:D-erythronate 2-dehydrogenase
VVQVVVTGGAGFLGTRLARELLTAGSLQIAGGPAQPVSRVTLIDHAPVPPQLSDDRRVSVIRGDLAELLEPAAAGRALLAGAEVIFHLAAAVSAECEADFDLGIQANVRATQSLLAACRALGTAPVVVFASSLAVFGTSAEHPLPAVIDDHALPNPQTSYGMHKLIGEQLLADYTRKGFLDGRAVRLMTVVVRPGRPNAEHPDEENRRTPQLPTRACSFFGRTTWVPHPSPFDARSRIVASLHMRPPPKPIAALPGRMRFGKHRTTPRGRGRPSFRRVRAR